MLAMVQKNPFKLHHLWLQVTIPQAPPLCTRGNIFGLGGCFLALVIPEVKEIPKNSRYILDAFDDNFTWIFRLGVQFQEIWPTGRTHVSRTPKKPEYQKTLCLATWDSVPTSIFGWIQKFFHSSLFFLDGLQGLQKVRIPVLFRQHVHFWQAYIYIYIYIATLQPGWTGRFFPYEKGKWNMLVPDASEQ